MEKTSTDTQPGGDKRSWRDRLGINRDVKGLPRLSDQFTEPSISAPAVAVAAIPAPTPPAPAPPVATPAAPARPVAVAPARPVPAAATVARPAERIEPRVNFPTLDAGPKPAAPGGANRFTDRLRQQRVAAEQAFEKRFQANRQAQAGERNEPSIFANRAAARPVPTAPPMPAQPSRPAADAEPTVDETDLLADAAADDDVASHPPAQAEAAPPEPRPIDRLPPQNGRAEATPGAAAAAPAGRVDAAATRAFAERYPPREANLRPTPATRPYPPRQPAAREPWGGPGATPATARPAAGGFAREDRRGSFASGYGGSGAGAGAAYSHYAARGPAPAARAALGAPAGRAGEGEPRGVPPGYPRRNGSPGNDERIQPWREAQRPQQQQIAVERQPEEAAYQGAHARGLAEVEEAESGQRPRAARIGRRATARDYDEAYQEYAEEYDQQRPPRQLGPWLLLGALICVALGAGAVISRVPWGSGESGPKGAPPVIAAPKEPSKIPPNQSQQADPAPSGKKIIYDRITSDSLGEQERLVSREEKPLQPGAQGLASRGAPFSADSEPLPVPQPPGIAGMHQPPPAAEPGQLAQPPAPAGSPQPAASAGLPQPAASGSEAALDPAGQPKTRTKALAAAPVSGAPPGAAPAQRTPGAGPGAAGPIQLAPLPGSTQAVTQGMPAPPGGATAQAVATPPPAQPAPAAQNFSGDDLFGDDLSASRRRSSSGGQQRTAFIAPTETPPPAAQPQAAPPSQPAQPPAAPQPGIGDGSYLLQLASFRSEEDALAEFTRLKSRHAGLIGTFSSVVQKTEVPSRGTFFRLNIGPITTKDSASRICDSLIAAGEKDCLVRRR